MFKKLYEKLGNYFKSYSSGIPLNELEPPRDENLRPFPREFAEMVGKINKGEIGTGNRFVTASGLMLLLDSK